MTFDLDRLARRLTAAAERSRDLEVTVSSFDLILSLEGHGAGRCESVPFASLFLSEQDVLGKALDRLGRASGESAGAKTQSTNSSVVSATDAPSMSAWPRDVEIAEG